MCNALSRGIEHAYTNGYLEGRAHRASRNSGPSATGIGIPTISSMHFALMVTLTTSTLAPCKPP
jgi:hypothetical protein